MRTAIACQFCRRSKVKCHHDGTTPCRACAAASRAGCVLSMPVAKTKKRRRLDNVEINSNGSDDGRVTHTSMESGRPQPRVANSGSELGERELEETSTLRQNHDALTCHHISAISNDLPPLSHVIKACELLSRLFPEFGFLHRPTFSDHIRARRVEIVKIWAILSVTARFIPEIADAHENPETAGVFYAEKARSAVMLQILDRPNPDTIQTLLLVGLHDWGACKGFRAWMLTGIAIRISQALAAVLNEPSNSREFLSRAAGSAQHRTSQECVRRTIWAAFVMDCLLSGGKHRPRSFEASRFDLPLPKSEEDFAFQVEPEGPPAHLAKYHVDPAFAIPASRSPHDCDESLSIIIQGLDIWASISRWICAGGRRKEPSIPTSSPWNQASVWSKMQNSLHSWRDSMSPKLQYSRDDNNLQAHMSRAQGEPFVFVNLIFYLSQIFLHREYIPFLPHRCSRPSGPIDPPLLVDTPPDGWWEASYRTLFDSAASVVDIIRAAQERGMMLKTVFVSFCVYSAAFTLLYAEAWPHMAPDAKQPSKEYQWALQWIIDAERFWKIVRGWKDTLLTTSAIYDRIKSDASLFTHLGRNDLEGLEDQINRFAEISVPHRGLNDTTPGGEGAAEALLTLAQQSTVPSRVDIVTAELHEINTQPEGELHLQSADPRHMYDIETLDSMIFTSQDLLSSVVNGSMDEWSQFQINSFDYE